MRVTAGGTRLIDNMRTGMVASGKRYSRPSALLPTPNVVWNGNPLCPPGCVLYLPGLPGSGANTYDYSGQKLIGAITGAVWTQLPSGLWVLTFDGDDKIDCGTSASLNFADLSPWTFSAWAKVTGSINWDSLVSPTGAWNYVIAPHTSNAILFYDVNATSHYCAVGSMADAWHLYTITMSSSRVAIGYKNGVSYGQFSTAFTSSAFGFRYIGYTADYRFAGIIGEVWGCNRALSAGEILRMYQATQWRYI